MKIFAVALSATLLAWPHAAASRRLQQADPQPVVRERRREPDIDDARKTLEAAFNLADAAGATDALDSKVEVRQAALALHEDG